MLNFVNSNKSHRRLPLCRGGSCARPGERQRRRISIIPGKGHKRSGFLSKPSNKNREVIFTPRLRWYRGIPSTLPGGHKTRPYAVEMGRGREFRCRTCLGRRSVFSEGYTFGFVGFERGFLVCCHASPSPVWGIFLPRPRAGTRPAPTEWKQSIILYKGLIFGKHGAKPFVGQKLH